MEFMTMLKLKIKLDMDGTVVRYKDFVVATEFVAGPAGEWFEVTAWQPVETEEETGIEFHNLRLENITEWYGERFNTEGEALMGAFTYLESMEG